MIWEDVKNVVVLDIKLMLKNRAVCIILFVVSGLFALILTSFSGEINKKSNIPIGIADEDQTKLSEQFLKNCEKQDGIYIYKEEKKNLEKKLYRNEIAGYFVIKKGFQKNVESGSVKKIFDLYYYKNTGFASIVSDILAGEVMYDLCISHTWKTYEKLDETLKMYQKEEFYAYMEELKENPRYQYTFDIKIIGSEKENSSQTVFQYQLIYQQVLLGIISMAFCIVIMFLVWSVMENPVSELMKRRNLLCISKGVFFIGDIISVSGVMFIYSILCSVSMWLMADMGKEVVLFKMIMQSILYCAYITILFEGIRKIIKNNMAYQFVGFFVIIFMGAAGTLGTFSMEIEKISKFIPNYWFIQGITDIIIKQ